MIKNHIKRIVLGGILGAAGGAAYWHYAPRIYESTAQVYVNTGSSKESDELRALLALGVSQSTSSEEAILRSEGTFKQALQNVAARRVDANLLKEQTESDLYLMYDIEAMSQSSVVTIKVDAYDPGVASDVANEVPEVYNDLRRKTSSAAYTNAADSLQQQLSSTEGDLTKAEQRLKDFKQKEGIADLAASTGQATGYAATLQVQLDSTQADDTALVREIAETKGKIQTLPATVETNLSEVKSPVLSQMEVQMADYETQRTELLRVWQPDSTKVKQLDGVIEQTRQRYLEEQKQLWQKTSRTWQIQPIRAALEMQLAQDQVKLVSLNSRLRSLRRELATNSAVIQTLPDKEQQLAALTRDQSVLQDKYMKLKAQVEDVRLQSNASFLPAALLYPAVPNDIAVFPKANKIVPLGLLGGCILGLLFSFVRESLRSTARTSEEVSSLFELPVVATVPSLSRREVKRNFQSLGKPTHAPPESFRFMASAAALVHGAPRTVIFTSSGGSVGCSTAASEFAVAAAKMGVQVTLIDADLTFGTVTKAFHLSEKPGLRDLLAKRLLATEDVRMASDTEHRGLFILPVGKDDGGQISDMPTDLLRGLLESLQAQTELMVIDCPPIDVVSDTSRFVPMVDEVCLVISARKTSLQAIANSRNLLERCGAKAVSVVLTGTAPKEEAFASRYSRYAAGRR